MKEDCAHGPTSSCGNCGGGVETETMMTEAESRIANRKCHRCDHKECLLCVRPEVHDTVVGALHDVADERDALKAALQRVRALVPKWREERVNYPLADARASAAFIAVKLCGEELEAALADPQPAAERCIHSGAEMPEFPASPCPECKPAPAATGNPAAFSGRWCDACDSWTDHHTDRHEPALADEEGPR